MSSFEWTEARTKAAIALANGQTQQEAGDSAGVSERTIQRWVKDPQFVEEVDRLTFLTGIASKAERLRLAKRVIGKLQERTEKDLLDWLKFAQSEIDGIKLDFTELAAALGAYGASVAGGGQSRAPEPDRPAPSQAAPVAQSGASESTDA